MSASDTFVLPSGLQYTAPGARAFPRARRDLAAAPHRLPPAGRRPRSLSHVPVAFITRPYCERLGIPFVCDPGPGIPSMQALTDPAASNRARAARRFVKISRTLVHALKYGDRLDRAPIMGRRISNAGREIPAAAPVFARVVDPVRKSI